MSENPPDLTRQLVGDELAAVIFVRDYVQLDFERHMLNAYSPLAVRTGQIWLTPDEPGWRDALCARIDQVVRDACTVAEREIRIEFGDGAIFSISLRSDEYRGPEAAELSETSADRTHLIVVWRSGD